MHRDRLLQAAGGDVLAADLVTDLVVNEQAAFQRLRVQGERVENLGHFSRRAEEVRRKLPGEHLSQTQAMERHIRAFFSRLRSPSGGKVTPVLQIVLYM